MWTRLMKSIRRKSRGRKTWDAFSRFERLYMRWYAIECCSGHPWQLYIRFACSKNGKLPQAKNVIHFYDESRSYHSYLFASDRSVKITSSEKIIFMWLYYNVLIILLLLLFITLQLVYVSIRLNIQT